MTTHSPSPRDTQAQFGRQARHFAESALHRQGESLETVRQLAAVRPGELVLDVGTGAGFTAFALAPEAAIVLATDLTPEMLRETRRLAGERGLSAKVALGLAVAEALPFRDATFHVVVSRYATHHFHDLPTALREFARVVRPDGRVVICDVVAPESEALTALMNRWEQRRDPTHVWDYPPSQWQRQLLPAAGLVVERVVPGKNPQVFRQWIERAGTPAAVADELAAEFLAASPEAQRAFEIRQADGEILFSWDNVTILARRAP